MRKIIFLFILKYMCIVVPQCLAQQISFVAFDALPADKQLYGRDANNEANINISGKIQASGYSSISVIRYRNDIKTGYQKVSLKYSEPMIAPFSINSKIKAELAEYSFEIYTYKSSTDSILIVRRDNIVAGDFYIIYGQSNAVAWEVDYTYRNEYCRTYGSLGGTSVNWGLSNDLTPRVGIFGIEFQSKVAEKYQIPTCVINGALAGASIAHLTTRNPDNHADASTPYGSLLYYSQQSGLLPYLKGIYYWQGENEAASEDPSVWAPRFDILMGQVKEDYPMIQKMYVFQLPLFGGGSYNDAIGAFREQQRTLDRKYPIIQPYAALGAPGWNGFHYGLDGYLKLGQEMADMAGFYHYGKKEKMTSPNLQKAYYSTPERNEITLVFEDYQQMVYPNDTISANIEGSLEPFSTYAVKDFFYLNAVWQKLKSGRAEANKIILTLKEVGSDSLIKYLPSKYHYAGLLSAPWVYIGPFLRNTKGFRAFAFHHNKIFPYKNYGNITLTAIEDKNKVVLNWNKLSDVTGYILERFQNKDSIQSHEIYYLTNNQTQYTDLTALQGIEYTYQIRGYTSESESAISFLTFKKQSDDTINKSDVAVYPNPTNDVINVLSNSSKINQIEIFSIAGIRLETVIYPEQNLVTLHTDQLVSGQYILKIRRGEEYITNKILVVR